MGSALRSKGARPFHSARPRASFEAVLQAARQKLLSSDVARLRGCRDRLHVALRPQPQQPSRPEQRPLVEGEEETVSRRPRPTTGPTQPLQERRDSGGRVDLNHAVEVTDVDAKLQRRGRHDHAVARIGEGGLGSPALVDGQRCVRQERRDVPLAKRRAQLLHEGTAVAEDEPLFSAVQRGDHGRRVIDGPDVVELDVDVDGRGLARCDDRRRAVTSTRPLEPGQQLRRVADRGRETDPLDRPSSQPGQPFGDGEEVPAAVVSRECVHLVYDDRAEPAEESSVVDLDADEHGLDRLGRGEQDIRWITEDLCRPLAPTSPCQTATVRPSQLA